MNYGGFKEYTDWHPVFRARNIIEYSQDKRNDIGKKLRDVVIDRYSVDELVEKIKQAMH